MVGEDGELEQEGRGDSGVRLDREGDAAPAAAVDGADDGGSGLPQVVWGVGEGSCGIDEAVFLVLFFLVVAVVVVG